MALLGFLVAVALFFHYQRRFRHYRDTSRLEHDGAGTSASSPHPYPDWQQRWATHQERHRDLESRHTRRRRRRLDEEAKRLGLAVVGPDAAQTHEGRRAQPDNGDAAILARARRRAAAEVGFYGHLMSYLGVMAFLALINLLTTRYPWFVWPAAGWGVGLFAHYMAVFGSRQLRERYFEPAVEREVRREKVMMQTEKQASLEELSSAIAHEIRNPIAAAKSLVQQMGEDPQSVENVEYAHVALDELDRVERRIAHLLKYAKDEDYTFEPVNLATVVDGALTQLRAKLDAARVQTARHYISGPTVLADREKLKQVFANVLDNAIDALGGVAEGRRIDLFVENGSGPGSAPTSGPHAAVATVRVRDNGCGIPPDKLPRIFTPFFTTKEKGTGLGMAISRKIVEAHEGSIDVASEPGRGTEFLVTLPLPH
jgi:signal transduction histidine kinase